MSGSIEEVSSFKIAETAFNNYKRRFLEGFFKSNKSITLNALFRLFKVRFYRFRPDLVYYLDNSIEFGFREKIEL